MFHGKMDVCVLLVKLSSYLVGEDVVVASDGASGGMEGAADEASCQGGLLPQVGPPQVLPSAGEPAEVAGHVAAAPFAAEHGVQHTSVVPCGSSAAR